MMWGIIVLMLAWGSQGALGDHSHSVMGRLHWCSTLCMCESETNTEVQCFEETDVYQLFNYTAHSIDRIRKTNYRLENKVHWCTELCLCHIETGKQFRCTQPTQLVFLIINKIGSSYFITPEAESDIKQESERSVDEDEDPALDEETTHNRRRNERKRNRKNRKQKKNQRTKHKNHEDSHQEPEPEPEPQLEPEAEVYMHSVTVTTTPPADIPMLTPQHFSQQYEVDEVEEIEEIEPLPKQQAVAASPVVTARQTPMHKVPPYSTAESYTPRAAAREVEGLSPRVQPVVEVPKEKKTVASMVSQDLDDLGTTVRNIKSDVMLNQRILLVTVAIAGVAMLGVLILAILSCSSRRQNQANNAKRDANKDGNHSPKINLEEAW